MPICFFFGRAFVSIDQKPFDFVLSYSYRTTTHTHTHVLKSLFSIRNINNFVHLFLWDLLTAIRSFGHSILIYYYLLMIIFCSYIENARKFMIKDDYDVNGCIVLRKEHWKSPGCDDIKVIILDFKFIINHHFRNTVSKRPNHFFSGIPDILISFSFILFGQKNKWNIFYDGNF